MMKLQAKSDAAGQRFQFHLSQLFLLVLVVAVATRQVLSPEWTVAERWLLGSWFVGWISGLAKGRIRGKHGIFSATLAGTACGFVAALVLYFGFPDLLRQRTMSFRQEVMFPLMTLFGLALISSVLLATIYHCVMLIVLRVKGRAVIDWRQGRIRVWFASVAALASLSVVVIWWTTFTWRPLSTLDVSHAWDEGTTGGIAFSPNGQLLALGSHGGFVEFWELPSLKRDDRHEVDLRGGVEFVEFSRGGAHLTCGSRSDPRVRVIEVASGEKQFEVNVGSEHVAGIASSDDLLTVVSISVDHQLDTTLWDTATGTQKRSVRTTRAGNAPVAHVDRGLLAYLRWHRTYEDVVRLGQGESTISLHRLEDGKHLKDGPTVRIMHSHFWPCFARDGDWLCMQNIVWNHETNESHQIPGDGLAFLPNGQLILVRSETGKTFVPLRPGMLWLFRTPFLRRLLVSRGWSRVQIYDVESRRIVLSSSQQAGTLFAWVSPDGRRMATFAGGSELKIWDIPK